METGKRRSRRGTLFCFFAAESWGNAFNDLLTLAGWSM